jgi:dTDP-4-dehydrorhamnose 3,5-epimerase
MQIKIYPTKVPDVKVFSVSKKLDDGTINSDLLVTFQWDKFYKYISNNAKPFLIDAEDNIEKCHTLRGLYFSMPPRSSSMLIRCIKGIVYQVAVDLRVNSPTYRSWVGIELSAENKKQMYIPEGFAQGYLTLCDDVIIQYKLDNYLPAEFCRIINYSDPLIGIQWPEAPVYLSARAKFAPGVELVEQEFAKLYFNKVIENYTEIKE